ncbi:hypothetical protein H5410_021431 [Solanum commersonii]|uniref:Uncharacterized protein n=1 Tax=Solanum commersonii TaxID=4109 RepID=A0A9J5ZH68_SOLCO|nr:hypothetical protein H5410_021431 [Solanum commersonii]
MSISIPDITSSVIIVFTIQGVKKPIYGALVVCHASNVLRPMKIPMTGTTQARRATGIGASSARCPRIYKLRRKSMMCAPPRALHLVCRLVDVTRTKAHDPLQGLVLTAIDRKDRDDSWMGRMFGMFELHLQIGGRPVTEDKMAFQEPIDDDDATIDEEDGSEEDE